MRASEMAMTVAALVQANQPVFVWGPPGCAKSATIRDVAGRLNRPLIDVRAVLLDPVDIRGVPSVTAENRVRWCTPEFLPSDPESNAILFLDELAQAAPMVQSAFLQLTLDRRIGEYELPRGVSIVAASNRQQDRAGAHRVITPLLNRFVHLSMDVSEEDWQAWAARSGIDSRVMAFLKFKPSALFKFDPKSPDLSFPTPRSWEFVSRCLAANPPQSAIRDIVAGCVGTGPATEFVAFCEIYGQLPDADDVLANPDTYALPTRADVTYALCGALFAKVRSNPNKAEAYATAVSRLPNEFAAVAMVDAISANIPVLKTKSGAEWIQRNKDVLSTMVKAA